MVIQNQDVKKGEYCQAQTQRMLANLLQPATGPSYK